MLHGRQYLLAVAPKITCEKPRVAWDAGPGCVACVAGLTMPLACVAGPPVALRLPRRLKPPPPSGPAVNTAEMSLMIRHDLIDGLFCAQNMWLTMPIV